MKNITVSVDDDTYRRARIHAAENDTSVSALVKEVLKNLAKLQANPVSDEDFTKLENLEKETRARLGQFSVAGTMSRDEIYKLSGELILDWGIVETCWYLILTCLLSDLDRAQIDAVYNSHETSASKLKLVLSIADAKFQSRPATPDRPHPIRKRMGQLAAKTEELAGIRNAIAHAQISPAINKLTFSPGVNQKKPNRLSSQDAGPAILEAIKKVELLCHDLQEFRNSLMPVDQRYLPKDLMDVLRNSGFQVPSWAIPSPLPSDDGRSIPLATESQTK